MDTRIGYPNEHLASNSADEMTSPMYSTGLGLVLMGMQRADVSRVKNDVSKPEEKETEQKAPKPKSNKVADWLDRFFGDGIS
jgi:cell division protein FtsA